MNYSENFEILLKTSKINDLPPVRLAVSVAVSIAISIAVSIAVSIAISIVRVQLHFSDILSVCEQFYPRKWGMLFKFLFRQLQLIYREMEKRNER